jgi:hypothetical protein
MSAPVEQLVYAKDYLRLFSWAGFPRDLQLPTRFDAKFKHEGLMLSTDGRDIQVLSR